MGGIQQTYNYYMSNYTSTQLTRYDTHKKSELRNICNIIKKLNKESPLYKVDLSKDMQRYVIDLKESARNIKNVVSALSDGADDINCFQRKVAISSQDDIVSTKYIGDYDQEDGITSFEIEVKQLATPQINLGNFLPSNQTTQLKPGTYSFDLNTGNMGFEFQFGVNEKDTNISIQRKLASLINDSNIGLTANILGEHGDQSSLEIKSVNTGIINNNPTIFTISKNSNPNSDTALSYLGIDEINQYPENSSFLLNGMEKFSYSNTFTVGKSFEVTMKGISEEDNPATISLKADADTIADNVQELVEAYNSSLMLTNEYASVTSYINKFQNEMENVTKDFSNQFEPIGLMIQKDGSILVDKQLLLNAVTEEDAKENFSVLKDFKNVVNTKANKAMLDPMQYVNKTLITYKNPGKTFADPYVTSIYSGMLFNGYC
ncbi:flagellar capping protein [Anaerosacchariphilus polymeriproducens]|uniref:Flagellar capping protein n=1 Tax=Anaerosacchariphilus polymeriproducens TaxID=1812858 RepID=A0A371AQK2_9FIRM|nr:flagellar capping protein [Anaerosacchariphilus polymeriproducens]RDU21838.1 flagellar capping protein [Anaerosacchariphilus polymeriproducens]